MKNNYSNNDGIKLYLKCLDAMNLQQKEKEEQSGMHTPGPNMIERDPFDDEYTMKNWNLYNDDDKVIVFQQTMKCIIKCENGRYRAGTATHEYTGKYVLSENDINKIESCWQSLNYHDRKTYLLKFCIQIGPDMNRIKGWKEFDAIAKK